MVKANVTNLTCQAYAGTEFIDEKHLTVETHQVQLEALGADEVQVKISACGICYTDIDAISGHYGPACGMVAGHEGVGIVTAVGSNVSKLSIGDLVGVGFLKDACHACDECLTGQNAMCTERKGTFLNGEKGCFSEYVQVDNRFAFQIPDDIPDEFAAPLLCAGATVYTPFVSHNITRGKKVGVIGIGGLGHLALQFGSALGCEMFALSSNDSKKEAAKGFGAKHFVVTSELESIRNTLDFVLVTTSGDNVAWQSIIEALRPNGKIILMGVSRNPIPVSAGALIMGQKSICGSMVASSGVMREMLRFASLHQIRPQIEVIKFDEINKGIQKVLEGSARYRMVLTR